MNKGDFDHCYFIIFIISFIILISLSHSWPKGKDRHTHTSHIQAHKRKAGGGGKKRRKKTPTWSTSGN